MPAPAPSADDVRGSFFGLGIQYYVAGRRLNGGCENALRMPVAEVNEAILQAVERHALTPEAIADVINFCERDDFTDLKTKIDRELKDTTQKLKRLTDLLENGAGDGVSWSPACGARGEAAGTPAGSHKLAIDSTTRPCRH